MVEKKMDIIFCMTSSRFIPRPNFDRYSPGFYKIYARHLDTDDWVPVHTQETILPTNTLIDINLNGQSVLQYASVLNPLYGVDSADKILNILQWEIKGIDILAGGGGGGANAFGVNGLMNNPGNGGIGKISNILGTNIYYGGGGGGGGTNNIQVGSTLPGTGGLGGGGNGGDWIGSSIERFQRTK